MVYVITGGPGFGKSVLIQKLQELGYQAGGENARQIIEQQIANGGELLPWKDALGFEKRVMNERIKFLQSIDIEIVAFSDRGLPDQAAFSRYKGKEVSVQLKEAIAANYYAKKVFLTPPWRDIYRNDTIRTETFEEAEKIHHFIVKAYLDNGYQLINLPFVSPDERIEFILKSL
ncbi:MAG: AAA family ATPase [Mariniphaga sp.]|nr:AAA family ATPase [Mariniphaga sp.]